MQPNLLLRMDVDDAPEFSHAPPSVGDMPRSFSEEVDSKPEEFKGFRRKWKLKGMNERLQHFGSQTDSCNDDASDSKPLGPQCSDFLDLHSDDIHGSPQMSDPHVVQSKSSRPTSSVAGSALEARIEQQWKFEASRLQAKRARVELEKQPWQAPPFLNVFTSTLDAWNNTMGIHQTTLQPSTIGMQETVDGFSAYVDTPQNLTDFPVPAAQSVRSLHLPRARKERPDDDIRRVALQRLQELLLSDPAATLTGRIVWKMHVERKDQAMIDQVLSDTYRAKSSATLQKRSCSLVRFARFMQAVGKNPLRPAEEDIYDFICNLRAMACGATSAQHLLEALRFLNSTAKFLCIDLESALSPRCIGAARDLYLTKRLLRQKRPLSAFQLQELEALMLTLPEVEAVVLGQLLFCVHSCARWSDAQRIYKLWIESGEKESLLHAEALGSKTSLTADLQRRAFPYVALGAGLSQVPWAAAWIKARDAQMMDCGDHFLPSFSEKIGQWVDSPMSSAEGTIWLRSFLSMVGAENEEELMGYGTHSCKPTLLTWIGRCSKVDFSTAERRALGHHVKSGSKSVVTYSRETFTHLYGKVLAMFQFIRSGQFNPDASPIDRVLEVAGDTFNLSGQSVVGIQSNEAPESEDEMFGSESSMASELDFPLSEAGDGVLEVEPPFDVFPYERLIAHKTSHVVHVLNEDSTLLCGRMASRWYQLLADSNTGSSTALDYCQQCVRAAKQSLSVGE